MALGVEQVFLNAVGNVLVFWAATVGVASVIVHSRVPWWTSRMGVHLMAYMSSVAVVLVLACVRVVFGDSWWFQLIRLIVFVAIPIVMTQRLVLQLSVQRSAAKAPQDMLDTGRHRAETVDDGDGRP